MAGEVIIHQGDYITDLHILEKGEIQLTQQNEGCEQDQEASGAERLLNIFEFDTEILHSEQESDAEHVHFSCIASPGAPVGKLRFVSAFKQV